MPRTPEVPEFPMARPIQAVSGTTLWSELRSSDFHQAHETGGGGPEEGAGEKVVGC